MSAVFQSWQNQNRYRTYPFRDDAVLSPAEDPGLLLPYSFIVDFELAVPIEEKYGVLPASVTEVRLSAMMYGGTMATLFFSGSNGMVASASMPDLAEHVPGTAYPVFGTGTFDDVRGAVVIGDLSDLSARFPHGSYTFSDALLEVATIRPVLRGVRSLRTSSGTLDSVPLYGSVRLVEGENVRLTVVPKQNAIRIDALKTDGFSGKCECEELIEKADISTINGISAPDVEFVGGECVKVERGDGNTLVISDTCSKPCCGCEELNFITTRLSYLENAVSRVESYANALNTLVPFSLSSLSAAKATGSDISVSSVDA